MAKDVTILGAAAIAGVSVAPLGHLLGVPLEAIIGGFGGAIFTRALGEPLRSIYAACASVVGGTLAGMFLGPYGAALLHSMAPIEVTAQLELYATSFILGAGAQAIVPAVINRTTRTIDNGPAA